MTDLLSDLSVLQEQPHHAADIAALHDLCFGPGRYVRTAERLREGNHKVDRLCRVGLISDRLCGTVRFWPIQVGDQSGLLLGPLAVAPDLRDRGIGLALMQSGLAQARSDGHRFAVLVGDEPYYARAGFKVVSPGKILLPGPFDASRLLIVELEPNVAESVRGRVTVPRGTTSTAAN